MSFVLESSQKKTPFDSQLTGHQQIQQETTQYLQRELKQIKVTQSSHQQQKYRILGTQKNTPLRFKFQIGNGYLISYRKSQLVQNVIKIAVQLFICLIMTYPLFYFNQVGQKTKFIVITGMYGIPFLYTVLFFLDAGTVFQDQDQNFYQERIYCVTCQIYRNLSTKHCSFCNRCCKKYDHHCSVFGKCIGKGNLYIFYLFLINFTVTFFLYFILALKQAFGQVGHASTKT